MGQYSNARGRGGSIQKFSSSFWALGFLVEVMSLSLQFSSGREVSFKTFSWDSKYD